MSGLSKEEIAKQFMLPERKSKIATLLKQDQAYCICRSSDSSRFMIACDSCEDWYHGDCIGISRNDAKYIKHYYCDRCRIEEPTLKTKYKSSNNKSSHSTHESLRKREKKEKDVDESRKHRRPRKYRDDDNIGTKKSPHSKTLPFNSSKSNRRKIRDIVAELDNSKRTFDNLVPRQCYGPECVKEARFDSKYCSDDCGMKLAYARIYHILPARLQERNMSMCCAELKNQKDLKEIREKQLLVRDILKSLDKRHKELDDIEEHVKTLKIMNEKEDEEEEENEIDMYCVTCGHQIHTKTAIKHMEKCFSKYESQSSFCSIQKTRIDGNNMFCDFFNPTNQTYCKRLRVLCPEHYKDPKISDDEVCGYPLVTDVFTPTGEYCLVPQKSCIRHYCWRKLRRAEIDMERVRQWLKLDELLEHEHQIRSSLLARTGVLNMMLHSTYDHELINKFQQMSAARQIDHKLNEDVDME